MIYEPDFAKWVFCVILSLGCIVCTYKGLRKLERMDISAAKEAKFCKVPWLWAGVYCIICSVGVCMFCWRSLLCVILFSVVGACLLAAGVMDLETHMVYNYVWWAGGVAGVLLMLLRASEHWGAVLLFWGVQELFFGKMYGRADCHGFCVCALAEAALGMGLQEYLLHMLWAIVLLAIVQLLRRNVGRKGNLKQAVAFLPYIVVAFWLNLCIYKSMPFIWEKLINTM